MKNNGLYVYATNMGQNSDVAVGTNPKLNYVSINGANEFKHQTHSESTLRK